MENKNAGNLTAGAHLSNWTSLTDPISFSALGTNEEADVVIVGGGLAGLTVAYCLVKAGKKIVLVEDGYIGSGETGRTTAHLVTALDNRYYKLEANFGEEKTRLIAMSHAAAIDFMENAVKREHIDCEFERLNGYLFLHPTDAPDSLQREFGAATRAGLNVFISHEDLTGMGSSLCFPGQAQFHPLKYLKGLCDAVVKGGGKIFTETRATEIDQHGIKTDKGFTVKAKHIVVATNSPVNNKYTMHLKQYAYRTYVIGALVKKNSLHKALWWDTGDFTENPDLPPYHYVRICEYDKDHDLLISGGEDHPIADTTKREVPEEKRYAVLEEWTRRFFPFEKIIYRWSGQVLEPMDGLAFIGRNPLDHDNIYIVTGDSGNGMTHCTIGGMLITDLILGKENPWEEIYRPSRFTLKASKPFFKEVIGSLLSTVMKENGHSENGNGHEDHVKLALVKRGEAKHLELRGEKCGVYRDEEGLLHIVSSTCTHLGCTVKWNNDEKSWDCPCHGSRYTYDGSAINGPTNHDLPSVTESEIVKEIK